MLGNGELLEFDAPDVLLSDNTSQFSSLVEQTGAAEAAHLRELAKTTSTDIKTANHELNENKEDDLEVETGENDPLLE